MYERLSLSLVIWLSCRLTLLRLFGLDQLGPHVGPYDVGFAEVPNPEHQTESVVPQRDDGVLGEHQSLSSFIGLGDLDKHTAHLRGKDELRNESESDVVQ